jgi:hypothetical protein
MRKTFCFVFLAVLPVACGGKTPSDLIVGQWEGTKSSIILEFRPDGSMSKKESFGSKVWNGSYSFGAEETILQTSLVDDTPGARPAVIQYDVVKVDPNTLKIKNKFTEQTEEYRRLR